MTSIEDIDLDFIKFEDTALDEELTGENCPVCGYPIVLEEGLELCYRCGWSSDLVEEEVN